MMTITECGEVDIKISATSNDKELAMAINGGNADAFTIFIDRYDVLLYQAAWRVLGDKELAQDAVQTALLKYWRKPSWSSTGGCSLSSWLYRIVLNCAIDIVRKRKKECPLNETGEKLLAAKVDDSSQTNPLRVVDRNEVLMHLKSILPTLAEKQQRVIVLAYFEQLPHKQVAEIMGISVKAVESLSVRAKRNLKAKLLAQGINSLDL